MLPLGLFDDGRNAQVSIPFRGLQSLLLRAAHPDTTVIIVVSIPFRGLQSLLLVSRIGTAKSFEVSIPFRGLQSLLPRPLVNAANISVGYQSPFEVYSPCYLATWGLTTCRTATYQSPFEVYSPCYFLQDLGKRLKALKYQSPFEVYSPCYPYVLERLIPNALLYQSPFEVYSPCYPMGLRVWCRGARSINPLSRFTVLATHLSSFEKRPTLSPYPALFSLSFPHLECRPVRFLLPSPHRACHPANAFSIALEPVIFNIFVTQDSSPAEKKHPPQGVTSSAGNTPNDRCLVCNRETGKPTRDIISPLSIGRRMIRGSKSS